MPRNRIRPSSLASCLLVATGLAGGISIAVAKDAAAPEAGIKSNPFYEPSKLPFSAPDFSKITDADFQPAIEEGMAQELAEIRKIADNPEPATFENTIVAMERTGAMLERVMAVFNLLTGANTNPALQKVDEAMAPKLAAHRDAIYHDAALFARIKSLYDRREGLGLDPESARLLEVDYRQFVHNGALLGNADQATLERYNEQLSTLSTQFQNKLLAATQAGALTVDDASRLAGLTPGGIDAAAEAAKARDLAGKWVIPLQNTTQQPALDSLDVREVRRQLFDNSWTRAEKGDANDTRAMIAEMAELRADKAKLLGFDNFAAWKLEDQMARTPSAVTEFLGQLTPPATARAAAEAQDRQQMIDADASAHGKTPFKLEPWDWQYYGQQVRRAKYDIDEAQVKPYFEMDNVLENGVFYAAGLLYGLTFEERKDIPVWNPDVRVFTVHDADGKPLGLFYADYYKRDNKAGGAWMSSLVHPSGLLGRQPVIYNVTNFTKPAPGQPALLSFTDVTTMFHEFGHALHGLLAGTKYPSLSATATARDWVEFPSQFNEHWRTDPKVFAHYAKHYETGAPMPEALAAKLLKSQLFNKGYDMTEVVSAASLDMTWHMLPATAPRIGDVDAFEAKALEDNRVNAGYVPPRYRSSYFAHIWGSGYAAGYYAYLWTQMLADDAFAWFEEHGGLTRANGDRFRAMILSRGNTRDLATLYQDWRGRAPTIDAMKKSRGLETESAGASAGGAPR